MIGETEGKGDASTVVDELRRRAGSNGIELAAVPTVTTRSGQKATVEVGSAMVAAGSTPVGSDSDGNSKQPHEASGEGTRLVITPTIGPDEITVAFTIELEHRRQCQPQTTPEGTKPARLAIGSLHATSMALSGQTRFLGALSSPSSEGTFTLAFIKLTVTRLNE